MMSTYFSFLKIPSLTLSTTIIFFLWSLIIWAMLRLINFNYVKISSHVLSTYPGTLALKMKACESMVSHVFIALLVEFIFSYYMYEDQNEFKRDHFWSKRKAMGIIIWIIFRISEATVNQSATSTQTNTGANQHRQSGHLCSISQSQCH